MTAQEEYQYKLLSITMNDDTVLQPGKLMVLVGPNNSGKSRALKDIAAQTTMPDPPPSVVVSRVEVEYPPSLDALRGAYHVERYQDKGGRWLFRTITPHLTDEHTVGGPYSWPSGVESVFAQRPRNFADFFSQSFGSALVAFLTTEARLQLVRQGKSPSSRQAASSLLQMLYNAGSWSTTDVSDLVYKTFGLHLALDYSVPQQLQLRVGEDFSGVPPDPRDARPLMPQYEELDEQGDGIRSFVGISVALLTLKRGLFLIDEPEAFLHPAQAYHIGAFIADQANRSRQIVIATHSTDVLRGILSRTRQLDIVRIDRVQNTNLFHHLDPERLQEVVNDPLLTSARVLDGLFYSAAVVVEADSDARFYHAASAKRASGLDLHFVNADNKQTVPRILRLYRDMGVRSAGIVDFDVLNDRTELRNALEMLGFADEDVRRLLDSQRLIGKAAKELPAVERLDTLRTMLDEVLTRIRETTKRAFTSPKEEQCAKESLLRQLESQLQKLAHMTKAWNVLKKSGRAGLPRDAAEAFDSIWDDCAGRGFFINPTGELESMLTEYGVKWTTDKRAWTTQALKLVPSLEPDDAKNPWEFLKAVHEHLRL